MNERMTREQIEQAIAWSGEAPVVRQLAFEALALRADLDTLIKGLEQVGYSIEWMHTDWSDIDNPSKYPRHELRTGARKPAPDAVVASVYTLSADALVVLQAHKETTQ